MVFWIGVMYYVINIVVSVSITFLLLERVFVVLRPINYKLNRKRFVMLSIFGFSISGLGIFIFIVAMELSTVEVLTGNFSFLQDEIILVERFDILNIRGANVKCSAKTYEFVIMKVIKKLSVFHHDFQQKVLAFAMKSDTFWIFVKKVTNS